MATEHTLNGCFCVIAISPRGQDPDEFMAKSPKPHIRHGHRATMALSRQYEGEGLKGYAKLRHHYGQWARWHPCL